MEGRLLARARARKAALRNANRAEENRRHREILEKIPEIKGLDASIRALMSGLVGVALRQETRTTEQLEKESLTLQARRAELLREYGYDEHYLDPLFSCRKCRDTGFVGETICECLLALYKQEQTKDLAPLLQQEPGSFETFLLRYYSPIRTASGESPRETMEEIFTICRHYADTFSADSGNLFLTGDPGLGKTFLSAAIARVVSAKGFSVAYDTASGLLTAFEHERFLRGEDEYSQAASRVRQLMSCDLLILDDLGTEIHTSFTQSALYALLDGRLRQKKKTIVSSNLNKERLQESYGPQLFSRLAGEYTWLEFAGRDIRALKKEGQL